MENNVKQYDEHIKVTKEVTDEDIQRWKKIDELECSIHEVPKKKHRVGMKFWRIFGNTSGQIVLSILAILWAAGLDDVRPINFLMKQPLNLYGLPRVMRSIERDFSYAFAEEHYPGAPILNTNDIEPEPFKIGKVEIIPIKLMHSSQRMAKQLPILGYRIKNFAYITDARGISWNEIPDIATVPFSPSEKAKLKGLDTLVINALRREEHYSHLSLPQTLSIIEQIQPRRAYLTHISHHLGLYEEVMKELPQNVFLGIDNQLIDIDDD